MHRTRIKFCGLTRLEDVAAAASLGADAIGLVFFEKSPRHIEPRRARALTAALPPFVTAVGLFVDPTAEEVAAVLDQVPLGLLQFHGDETPEFCASFHRPWIKAVRMRSGVDLHEQSRRYGGACGLLLDAFDPAAHGGTGLRFDWMAVPPELSLPLVVAGGLDPANVGEAVRHLRPWGVDVSSGIEAAKGIKDPARMAAFVAAVRAADAEQSCEE